MILGQTIFTDIDGGAEDYYTPWFPAAGNYATFVLEILNITQNTTVTIETQTKNSEQDDQWGSDPNQSWSGGTGWSTVGMHTFNAGKTLSATGTTNFGLLELIRFKISISASAGGTPGLSNIRMLAPSFQTH